MKKIILFLILTLVNTQLLADHFPDFPPFPVTAIQAHTIMEGDEVFFGYSPSRYPCLQSSPNFQGISEYIEFDGNNIEITVSALGNFPCHDLDTDLIAYEFYNLGTMPAGVYNIQMYWTDPSTPLPVPVNLNRLSIGGIVQFEVLTPKTVPSLAFISLLLLISGVMFLGLIKLKKIRKLTIFRLFALVFSQNTLAKTFHILLNNNGVSAEDIMTQSQTSPSPPGWLLSSFNISPPQTVMFLA